MQNMFRKKRLAWNLLIIYIVAFILCYLYHSPPERKPVTEKNIPQRKTVIKKNMYNNGLSRRPAKNCTHTKEEREHIGSIDGLLHGDDKVGWGPHRLAVLVPFRDRFDELQVFAPAIHRFLNMQKVRHKIYVINQVDQLRFNRGSLINTGFSFSKQECDYIAIHDVDLLPVNNNLSYAMPEKGPFHASSPELHPLYHYRNFLGGVVLLTNRQFIKVNGFSNRFFGWGKEDDEFYLRIQDAQFQIFKPTNIATGNNTFMHIHKQTRRVRDKTTYNESKPELRDRSTGLDTVSYKLVSRHELTIDGAPVTILNVKLCCDRKDTPWCKKPRIKEVESTVKYSFHH